MQLDSNISVPLKSNFLIGEQRGSGKTKEGPMNVQAMNSLALMTSHLGDVAPAAAAAGEKLPRGLEGLLDSLEPPRRLPPDSTEPFSLHPGSLFAPLRDSEPSVHVT